MNIAPALRFALPTLHPVTLKAGRVAYVRKLDSLDFVQKLGVIPSAFRNVATNDVDPVAQRQAAHFAEKHPDFARNLTMLFLSSVAAVGVPDPDEPDELLVDPLAIVEKPQKECGPGELSVEYLDPDDALAIVNAQTELNGMTREAGENARGFFSRTPTCCLPSDSWREPGI